MLTEKLEKRKQDATEWEELVLALNDDMEPEAVLEEALGALFHEIRPNRYANLIESTRPTRYSMSSQVVAAKLDKLSDTLDQLNDRTSLMNDRMNLMNDRVTLLNGRIKKVERMFGDVLGVEDEGEEWAEGAPLDVSDEEAQEMILKYMKTHERAWPQDISLALKLDFGQVMRVTRELLKEGVIADSDSE